MVFGKRSTRVHVKTWSEILAAALAWCLSLTGQELPPVSDYQEDVRGTNIFTFKIHPALPEFQFTVIGDVERNAVTAIHVFRRGESNAFQVLTNGWAEPPYRNAEYFAVEDINFDGFKDVRLLVWSGATGNKGFDFWLYDTNGDSFIYSRELRELCNPAVDKEHKLISTPSTGGMAGRIYRDARYGWENGQLVLLWQQDQDERKSFLRQWVSKYVRLPQPQEVSFVRITRERRNGKLRITEKRTIRGDEE
jgi:hypothetical protein